MLQLAAVERGTGFPFIDRSRKMSRLCGIAVTLLVFPCVACSRDEYDQMNAQAVTDANFDIGDVAVSPFDAGPATAKPLKLLVDVSGQFSRKSDRFDIETTELQGDLLKLVVAYGGGCETHGFVIWTDNSFSQGRPTAIKLFVAHDSHGDTCEALIQRALWIDLLPIKAAFLKANPSQVKGLIAIVLENNGSSVQYKF
ncbi:hypothetical protein OAG82_04110 [Rubripirellula sp.]|nr:hypothetical protein [Rubripirellula sp.]MDA7893552.1 hypothetical protein [bacterium]MDB4622023.1 hypothetical protein [Rubripirellula sp.]